MGSGQGQVTIATSRRRDGDVLMPRRGLIVDNQSAMWEVLDYTLRASGYKVNHAETSSLCPIQTTR